eukprot:TRINITY_DN4882_c0_g1_i2.p1 TRINITY_DN4882_c0_g1~~TRINITY_DN4882_c0_g1_i2.p1  ORF type:complete len:153 (+),score=26.78 TRINITY_DN4882_c0_g1_i2:175-633(+)
MIPAPPYRAPNPNRRVQEILEALKNEYDSIMRESNLGLLQREEFEKLLLVHKQENQSLQEQLFELEQYHKEIVGRYQEEVTRLKTLLESLNNEAKYEIPKGRSLPNIVPNRSAPTPPLGIPNITNPVNGMPGNVSSVGRLDEDVKSRIGLKQ